ncbi:MAG: alpha/beta hydrolase-fold protein, partial [Candidatus Saccharimonadales bacterium]
SAAGYPDRLSKLPQGRYRVQAQLDHNPDTHHAARGEGNDYSAVVEWSVGSTPDKSLQLTLDRVVGPPSFQETAWLKEIVVASPLLSDFHHRPVRHVAAVVLPPSYDRQPERRYPVIYMIPGFGGTHYDAMRNFPNGAPPAAPGETEFIRVALSGDCKWGHHAFADSATNGPRGTALVEELIPHIDAHFRTVAAPAGRFVTGHSSGGWASLWLQVSQPDVFGGVWSTAPDPVDFRDWQQVNLYVDPPLSLYYDERARPGPSPVAVSRPCSGTPRSARWTTCWGAAGSCVRSRRSLARWAKTACPAGCGTAARARLIRWWPAPGRSMTYGKSSSESGAS